MEISRNFNRFNGCDRVKNRVEADVEIAVKSFIASKNSDFFRNEIDALVYLAQRCVDCNGTHIDQ